MTTRTLHGKPRTITKPPLRSAEACCGTVIDAPEPAATKLSSSSLMRFCARRRATRQSVSLNDRERERQTHIQRHTDHAAQVIAHTRREAKRCMRNKKKKAKNRKHVGTTASREQRGRRRHSRGFVHCSIATQNRVAFADRVRRGESAPAQTTFSASARAPPAQRNCRVGSGRASTPTTSHTHTPHNGESMRRGAPHTQPSRTLFSRSIRATIAPPRRTRATHARTRTTTTKKKKKKRSIDTLCVLTKVFLFVCV